MAATSPTNAWAVGSRYFNANGGVFRTLVERWDGRTWKQVPSPDPAGTTRLSVENVLDAVAATSLTDAWAVGTYSTHGSSSGTLVERWNGVTWKHVPSPNPASSQSAMLSAVAAISAGNAWAVGGFTANGSDHTLIEHWNGATWKQVPSPNPGSSAAFFAVTATSPTSAWAVGDYQPSGSQVHTLIEHWNGATWKQVPSPSPGGSGTSSLFAVTATSPTSAWAAGFYAKNPLTFMNHTLIEHWNGKKWLQAPSPGGGTLLNPLAGVAATSSGSAWAVGGFLDKKYKPHTLIERWNGATWETVRSADPLGRLTST